MTRYHIHELGGCAPVPLAGYLKALGIMRVVSERKDAGLRGFWRGDRFFLATRLRREELLELFAWEFRPSSLVSPWNAGSGFYSRENNSGVDEITRSTTSRLAGYRAAIAACLDLLGDADEVPRDQDKVALVRACRARLRGSAAEWLDTAVVMGPDGRLQFPAILGTGGNDGRLDFSNNFMQRVVELLALDGEEPRGDAEELLAASLFGDPVAGLYGYRAIGQFSPGAVGGPNMGSLGTGHSLINPWDFVLMLEGVLLCRVSALRRLDVTGLPQAAAPFAVRAQAVDYLSASPLDESARGEQWLPMWRAPATLPEIRALFEAARLQSGKRRARRALDVARAVARKGAARGVDWLARFGFIERNGQANLAVPLGRWPVTWQPFNDLLDDIELWVDITRQRGTSKYAPASLGRHVREIESIMFSLCHDGDRPERWGDLLCALGHYEDRLAARPRSVAEIHATAVPGLSPEWVHAADDGSAEFRLAVALASQYSRDAGSIRRHCVPPDPRHSVRYGGRFQITAEGMFGGRDLVWTGLDPITDLCALVWRRLERSRAHDMGGFELRGRVYARLEDVHDFLAGAVDDARLVALARGLMAVRWHEPRARNLSLRPRTDQPGEAGAAWRPWPVYALFRLLYMPTPLLLAWPSRAGIARAERSGAVDPEPLRLLLSGRLHEAIRQAQLRLAPGTVAGPGDAGGRGSARLAWRLAASLCFPINPGAPMDPGAPLDPGLASAAMSTGACPDIVRLRHALAVPREHAGAAIFEPHPHMENP